MNRAQLMTASCALARQSSAGNEVPHAEPEIDIYLSTKKEVNKRSDAEDRCVAINTELEKDH